LKNVFLKNIGQELRTPLANMKTALTLLNSPQLKTTQRQRYMDLLSQECDRQSSLITSVLDLTQLEDVDESVPIKPLRIVDVVPAVVSTYQPLAQEKGIALAYTIPPDLPTVSCLSNWLRQVVINLLHNAIKFTPGGGKVWVRARQQGDYVQIEVRDTGIGIATADIPKIFNRFYRVRHSKDDSSGAGLGLAIVQQLLLRCGGSISVNSRQGEGSAFNVMLPLYGKEN
ncbi:MAG TPA: sensor histidine kinase, partial [Elainellaceae cyanobacterium]